MSNYVNGEIVYGEIVYYQTRDVLAEVVEIVNGDLLRIAPLDRSSDVWVEKNALTKTSTTPPDLSHGDLAYLVNPRMSSGSDGLIGGSLAGATGHAVMIVSSLDNDGDYVVRALGAQEQEHYDEQYVQMANLRMVNVGDAMMNVVTTLTKGIQSGELALGTLHRLLAQLECHLQEVAAKRAAWNADRLTQTPSGICSACMEDVIYRDGAWIHVGVDEGVQVEKDVGHTPPAVIPAMVTTP